MQIATATRWAGLWGFITPVTHLISAIFRGCKSILLSGSGSHLFGFETTKHRTCFPRRGLSFFFFWKKSAATLAKHCDTCWNLSFENQTPAISQGGLCCGGRLTSQKNSIEMIFTFAFLEEQIFVCPKRSWLTETGNGLMEAIDTFNEEKKCMEIQYTHETQRHEGLVEDDFPPSVTTVNLRWTSRQFIFRRGLNFIRNIIGESRDVEKAWKETPLIWGFPKMVVPNNHGFSY